MLREGLDAAPADVVVAGHLGTARPAPAAAAPPSGGVGMRVAVVAETFLPAVNGVVNSVLRLVDHLAVRGHDPVVVAPSGAGYESRCGAWVDVATVPSMRLPGYRQLSVARPAGDLTRVLGRLAPDVVHLASPAVLGLAAARAARTLGVPSIAVFQTDLAAYAEHYRLPGGPAAAWRYLRAVHETAALTLAPSTTTQAMLARHGIGPVTLWPRGVDLDQFAPEHRDPALHHRLAPGGELLVGVVARLAVEKRLALLAPLSELPGVRLVVVGDGPQRRQLARRMPRAHFLGQLGGAELGAVVASLDLFVHPGADETFCQAVQEALAAGVPAVVAASGGPLDLVRHGQNGWLWAGDDPHLLAAMVAGLRDDPVALGTAADRARPSVEERTWGRIGDELIGHLQRLRAHRSAP
ncbi:glycosyltransferase family 1 protein [Modestobacter marinus]|uniref:GDP-mannose-dependent alpha-mannosyltransferase n=1 Tax=Modestobacter marinus TaxID=477641 RepID=A0A846LLK3_9ACTN|nr:glycosyltransferase family 1 protein [Modestobacter marinus]NIH66992.1 phosphatidylinositol alpha 1,6-mannosyltransferase [Modestobacter marinus]GGL51005.1 GDP-mannose-dependent alpha-mannosyltransferase [Modestobacter marinus]